MVGVGEDVVEVGEGQLVKVGDVDVVFCSLFLYWSRYVLEWHGVWRAYTRHGFDEPESDHDKSAFLTSNTCKIVGLAICLWTPSWDNNRLTVVGFLVIVSKHHSGTG